MKNSILTELFWQWCKETKRSGGVVIGSSLREFLVYLEDKVEITKKVI